MLRDGKKVEGKCKFAITMAVVPVVWPAASWKGRYEVDEETFKKILTMILQSDAELTTVNSLDVRSVEEGA
jgi:hypothetical protein